MVKQFLRNNLMLLMVCISIILVYGRWLLPGTLSSGDWPYLYRENIEEFSWFPQSEYVWLAPFYQIPSKILVQYAGIPWEVVERLVWFIPFLILSIFSSYKLTRSPLGVLVYALNPYILMVVGGGQMGVAMAYALAPLSFKFLKELKILKSKEVIWTSLLFSLQTMLDPRLSVITLFAVFIYVSFVRTKSIALLVIPAICSILINAYWIIPVLNGTSKIFSGLTQGNFSPESLQFLSFADFPRTLSLLHPNWPENIFGKVYFMEPVFLLIPLVSFSILLFKKVDRNIVALATIALIGAFLSKGTNEPFGVVYSYLYALIPGFSIFRDPTKFYLLTILAYAILVPLSLKSISTIPYKKRPVPHLQFIVSSFFTVFFLLLIKPALFGELTGTFKTRQVPVEYGELKTLLVTEKEPFAVLWVPARQRFGFKSTIHPAIESGQLNSSLLDKSTVRYVIIPSDSEHELFIKDRNYSQEVRDEYIRMVEGIPGLLLERKLGDIRVYRVTKL